MGLNLTRAVEQQPISVTNTKNEIEVVEHYDIMEDRQQLNQQLVNSAEIDALASKIEVYDLQTIISFGEEVTEEISKASNVILNSVNMSQLDDSSKMLNTFAKIMSKFDASELKEKPGLLGKLFNNAKKRLDKSLPSIIQWVKMLIRFTFS